MLYQTLLQLRKFVGKWCNTVIKVNNAKTKCFEDIEKNCLKNKTKMESIHTRSSNGKVQEQVRDSIQTAEFDNAYDVIYKIRKQMDNDYNTLEKWLDELGDDCEKLIDMFKKQLQKIIDIKNFTDVD
jgi:hypothetical protein